MIKIIAIGNRLMADDGVALRVLEQIKAPLLSGYEKVELLIGETDMDYCLNEIKEEDFIILVDSTHLGVGAGTITSYLLKNIKEVLDIFTTPHDVSLLHMLPKSIEGYFIGIEVEYTDFSLDLSETLKSSFNTMCLQVLEQIRKIINNEMGENHA